MKTEIDVTDFDLRYDNRVLVLHVYVRTRQDDNITKLHKSVIRAAKGPRLDACATWMVLVGPDHDLGVEAEKWGQVDRANIEALVRGSTTVAVFHLFVNTDTDAKKLGENVVRAARGALFNDVGCVIEEYVGDTGAEVWSLIQQTATAAHADPAAKPYSVEE